jgi:sulfur oxidation c-type cytochrome SoxA
VQTDAELRSFIDLGGELFHRRQDQLNLSCSQCHDDNWGKPLAGAVIPQGHPTGYPVYRLEWQSLGRLQRRLRNCIFGVRAEPDEYSAPEAVALELYLMARARGMRIETPAVRPLTRFRCRLGKKSHRSPTILRNILKIRYLNRRKDASMTPRQGNFDGL